MRRRQEVKRVTRAEKIADGFTRCDLKVLPQNMEFPGDGDRAARRRQVAGYQFEQRGFTRTGVTGGRAVQPKNGMILSAVSAHSA